MLGRTFRTLKKNPKITLLFGAMYLVPIVLFVVLAISVFPEINNLSSSYLYDNPEHFNNFMLIYSAVMGASTILGLLMVTLVLPSVFNYIYEVCAGLQTEGWYKRGLKRSWWKILVLFLIYMAVVFALSLVFMIFAMVLYRAMWIAMIIMYLGILVVAVYMTIAMAAVIAEDDFGKALGNSFTLGSKYFFKLLGTMVLVMIPSFIVSGVFSVLQMRGVMMDSFNLTYYTISILFAFIYGIFAYSYLYTYAMNSYLNEKGMFGAPAPTAGAQPETLQSIEADSDK